MTELGGGGCGGWPGTKNQAKSVVTSAKDTRIGQVMNHKTTRRQFLFSSVSSDVGKLTFSWSLLLPWNNKNISVALEAAQGRYSDTAWFFSPRRPLADRALEISS